MDYELEEDDLDLETEEFEADDVASAKESGGQGEQVQSGGGGGGGRGNRTPFAREIRQMLVGFGDAREPDPETVALLEQLANQFLRGICLDAIRLQQPPQSTPSASAASSSSHSHSHSNAHSTGSHSHSAPSGGAQVIAKRGPPIKLQIEQLLCLLRRDSRKYSRVRELLVMYEELKKARRALDLLKNNADGK